MTKSGGRWQRFLRYSAVVVAVIGGGYFVAYWIAFAKASSDLQAAIAAVDAAEPGGWQLANIEARRPKVDEAHNGSKVVAEAAKLLPDSWKRPKLFGEVWDVRPCEVLSEPQANELKEELDGLLGAREAARRLVDYPTGRFPTPEFTPDFGVRPFPHEMAVANTIYVLSADAALLIQEKQLEKAWESGVAMLHAGRCLVGEPRIESQLYRAASLRNVVFLAERLVGHGTLSDEQLSQIARHLEQESADIRFADGFQNQRAGSHQLFSAVEKDEFYFPGIIGHQYGTYADFAFCTVGLRGSMIRNSHAMMLRDLTELSDIMKKPPHEAYEATEKMGQNNRVKASEFQVPGLARAWAPASIAMARAEFRTKTQVACATLALAAERYRLRHQHWPSTLAELVTEGLASSLPLDIYDGQPLRLRQASDGIVIFSVGPLKKNDGKARDPLDQEAESPSEFATAGMEFRLWDVNLRRQPSRRKE